MKISWVISKNIFDDGEQNRFDHFEMRRAEIDEGDEDDSLFDSKKRMNKKNADSYFFDFGNEERDMPVIEVAWV